MECIDDAGCMKYCWLLYALPQGSTVPWREDSWSYKNSNNEVIPCWWIYERRPDLPKRRREHKNANHQRQQYRKT